MGDRGGSRTASAFPDAVSPAATHAVSSGGTGQRSSSFTSTGQTGGLGSRHLKIPSEFVDEKKRSISSILKIQEAFGAGVEIRKIMGWGDLPLDKGEMGFDRVEPTGMDGDRKEVDFKPYQPLSYL